MDISSALALFASRKQLRRFAASLSLSADEPGSLSQLLALDVARVENEVLAQLAIDPDARVNLLSALEQWRREGPPADSAEDDEADAEVELHSAQRAFPEGNRERARSCVECKKSTPFVFEILSCRLCERCEPRNGGSYGLLTAAMAESLLGVSEHELERLRWGRDRTSGTRVFLRTDVEAVARGSADASEKQTGEKQQEWRDNSFSVDHTGKTRKWKEWNSATFQRRKNNEKTGCSGLQKSGEDAIVEAMLDLSGLRYVGE